MANLDELTVSASGINTSASIPIAGGARLPGKAQRVGTKLYTQTGHVLDASTGAVLGQLALPGSVPPYAVLPDESKGRIFVWTAEDMIRSYDISTLEYLGEVPVFGVAHPGSLGVRNMTLWGTDGVAMTDGIRLVVLSGPFFTTYRGP